LLTTIRHIVLGIIDFFHKPFSGFIEKQTFRYLACGGSNAVLNIALYFLSFHYLLHEKDVLIGTFTISSAVAAFIISFVITFPIGFVLSRYIVFPESTLRGRVQLIRYLALVVLCVLLNWFFIRFFVNYCHIFPTVANILTNILVAIFSYFSQRAFTFKVKKAPVNS